MAEQALSTTVATAQKAQSASSGLSGALWPRLITGFVILLTWEIVVRAFAPAYVAKPTTIILAIPKVLTEPAFLQALGSIFADCVQLVKFIFTEPFTGKSVGAERETGNYQHAERGED